MATYTKIILSSSTDGLPIKVAATATSGTAIHTAHPTAIDEVYLWAMNTDTSNRKLTIEFGGTTAPDHLIEKTISAEDGLVLIVPGLPLTNSKPIRAFASTTNVITIVGYVNRIS